MITWPLSPAEAWRARKVRRSLAPPVRARLASVRRGFLERPGLAQPLALARFVVLDLETTGPRMYEDRIISIGAVAVTEHTVRHDDAFEAARSRRPDRGVPIPAGQPSRPSSLGAISIGAYFAKYSANARLHAIADATTHDR